MDFMPPHSVEQSLQASMRLERAGSVRNDASNEKVSKSLIYFSGSLRRIVRNLPAVTGMRGVASLLVVGFHTVLFFVWLGQPFPHGIGPQLLNLGWIGVDFFFVLSGFLLSLPILANPNDLRVPRFWGAYLVKRWFRIAPPYYASILFALVLLSKTDYLVTGFGDVVRHLLYAQNFDMTSTFSIDPVYWSLAVEAQFYLILPLFALLFTRRLWGWSLGASLGVTTLWRTLAYVPADPLSTQWLNFQLPAFLGHFALGICTARLYLDGRGVSHRARVPLLAAAGSFIVIPLVFLVDHGEVIGATWQSTQFANAAARSLIALGFAAILFWMVAPGPAPRQWLSSSLLQGAGKISYSIYLVHAPLLAFILLRGPPIVSQSFPTFAAAGLIATILVAVAFYWLTERPSLWIKAALASRIGPPHPASNISPDPLEPVVSADRSHVPGRASAPHPLAASE